MQLFVSFVCNCHIDVDPGAVNVGSQKLIFTIKTGGIDFLFHRIVRMFSPVQVWQAVIHLVHRDTFWYRANQVAEITANAFLVDDRVGTFAVIVFFGLNGLV